MDLLVCKLAIHVYTATHTAKTHTLNQELGGKYVCGDYWGGRGTARAQDIAKVSPQVMQGKDEIMLLPAGSCDVNSITN